MTNPRTHRRYRRWRRAILDAQPLCVLCLDDGRHVEAEELDHIVPIYKRPDLLTNPRNVQALCARCHAEKTAHDRPGPPRAPWRDLDPREMTPTR